MFCRRVFRSVFTVLAVFAAGCSVYREPYDGPVMPYAVQRGDTITDISRRSGVDVDSIIEINELDDADTLRAGQILYLPGSQRARWQPDKSPSAPEPLVADLSFVRRSSASPLIGKLYWPVEGGKLGSHFGERSGNFHEGVDIRAEIGTSIFAAHDGVVAFSGKLWSGYGNMIIIKGDGLYTVYAHNNMNFLEEGDEVERGDEIATVGKSGNASGPHLHFEVRIDDDRGYKVAVNPLIFLKVKR